MRLRWRRMPRLLGSCRFRIGAVVAFLGDFRRLLWGIRGGLGRLFGTLLLDLAPTRDVFVVLVERIGKHVTAGSVGHEIEIIGT